MRVSTGKEGQEGNGAEGEEGGRELTMKQRMGESGGERWTTKGIFKEARGPTQERTEWASQARSTRRCGHEVSTRNHTRRSHGMARASRLSRR